MSFTELRWQFPPSSPTLHPGNLHLWCACLDQAPAAFHRLQQLLSPDELDRATRIPSATARRRFVAGRGLIRTILGRYLDLRPDLLVFSYGRCGKPALSPDLGDDQAAPLQFNVAHAESLLLCAITREREVGVDLEPLRAIEQTTLLASHFFSRREKEELWDTPEEDQSEAFLNGWTRKEAFLKAVGLNEYEVPVEVSLRPGQSSRLLSIGGDEAAAGKWSVHAVAPAPGFVGAVAVRGGIEQITAWRWPEDARTSFRRRDKTLGACRN